MTGPGDAAWVLARPDAWIDARGPRHRVRLARRGAIGARRVGDGDAGGTVELLTGPAPDGLVEACGPALAGIGRAAPALSVSFPTALLIETGCRGPDAAAVLRGAGCDRIGAARAARVLAGARSAAEFTFGGPAGRTPTVLALLGGPDGAVLARTAPAADGVLWTAVCEGTVHRLAAALRRGCEDLPGGGWAP